MSSYNDLLLLGTRKVSVDSLVYGCRWIERQIVQEHCRDGAAANVALTSFLQRYSNRESSILQWLVRH
jgi:uncharacterized membrane protein YozB (DUF420 family)